jgi:tetratricopeptide (TPR) repeat protein
MFFRRFFAFLILSAVLGRGQEPLNAPVPLVPPLPPAISPGGKANQLAAARSAQELGLDSIAAGLYAPLLRMPGADQAALTLALATVLLDDGRAAEAEQLLQTYNGPRPAAWHLRAALAAGQLKKAGPTRAEFEAIRPEELPKADHGWFFFLQGMLTDLEGGNQGKANEFYQQALDTATTEFAKVRFQLALEYARLRNTPASDATIEQTRQNMERYRGRATGYDFARALAVMLDAAGRKSRAVELLQEQLRNLPPQEHARLDDFRLLLGLIGGAAEGAGRNAFFQLLERGSDANKQRIALQLLARASQVPPERTQFRSELDRLIGATPSHRIMEDLLLFRAQVALATKTAEGYAQAEEDANALRQKFPGSPLLAHAYTVLTASAWEQHRYRIAADNAAKARDALPAGAAHAELGVLVAEAWFRAGKLARAEGAGGAGGAADFRNAADAYANALRDPPPDMAPADLMYQRVLSEIESGSLEGAQALLDELALDPAFAQRNRWQAEWNLARALQAAGKTAEAFARVSQLLAPGPAAKTPALAPALRAQMAWLQARLSFDLEPSDQTLAFIDKLDQSLAGIDARMKTEIASTGLLLKAQTNFALKRDAAGTEALKALQKNFKNSTAAIYSYIVEADRDAQQDRPADAQTKLTKLAHDFPDSDYAPYALYQAALQAERRGQKENFEEAVRRIEELISLVEKYPPKDPANDLVFAARMKQGDLLRQLKQFSQARDTYQSLIHNYPQHGDVILAQLALAECLNAESAADPAQGEHAQDLFEHLLARLDAPLDVRVEAGYNFGESLARRGEMAKALEVWWRDVAHAFLHDPATAERLGTTGRYWMARTLRRTAEVLEQQQRLEEAKTAWLLLLNSNLGWEVTARQQLQRFNLPDVAR